MTYVSLEAVTKSGFVIQGRMLEESRRKRSAQDVPQSTTCKELAGKFRDPNTRDAY